ncbi:MAG: hypothetical protein ACN2B6_04390 [Rickettsiales bacterium]
MLYRLKDGNYVAILEEHAGSPSIAIYTKSEEVAEGFACARHIMPQNSDDFIKSFKDIVEMSGDQLTPATADELRGVVGSIKSVVPNLEAAVGSEVLKASDRTESAIAKNASAQHGNIERLMSPNKGLPDETVWSQLTGRPYPKKTHVVNTVNLTHEGKAIEELGRASRSRHRRVRETPPAPRRHKTSSTPKKAEPIIEQSAEKAEESIVRSAENVTGSVAKAGMSTKSMLMIGGGAAVGLGAMLYLALKNAKLPDLDPTVDEGPSI